MDNVNTRFEVLGDPTRMQILGILSRGNKLRAKDILEHLKISQPTLSHHMQLLTSSKIVSAQKVGRECFYMINEKSILEMKNCLSALLAIPSKVKEVKEDREKKDKKEKKKKKKDKKK